MAGCEGNSTAWAECGTEYAAVFECLNGLTCDEYFSYYAGDPHDCEAALLNHSKCIAGAGRKGN